jgi:hypothetical protein
LTAGYLQDADSAIQRAEHALLLSPLAPNAYFFETVLAQAYYIAARYSDAVSIGRRAFTEAIGQTSSLRVLIASLVAIDEIEQARLVATRLMAVDPNFRLAAFAARTPLRGTVRDVFVQRLRLAGLED